MFVDCAFNTVVIGISILTIIPYHIYFPISTPQWNNIALHPFFPHSFLPFLPCLPLSLSSFLYLTVFSTEQNIVVNKHSSIWMKLFWSVFFGMWQLWIMFTTAYVNFLFLILFLCISYSTFITYYSNFITLKH